MSKKVLYMCDGQDEQCSKNSCFRKGGECFKTTNVEHAINFIEKKDYFTERATKINVPELFSTGTIRVNDLP